MTTRSAIRRFWGSSDPHMAAVALGFLGYYHDTEDGSLRVMCSQCHATIIVGTPTHERGCSKKRQAQIDQELSDSDQEE